jgi:Domain of unknown function (DUF4169)
VAEAVNLRRFKKAKARADAAKTADERRIVFGRSKSEKKQSTAEKALATRKLDQHKRDE